MPSLDSPISDRPQRTNQPAMIKNSESGIGVGRVVSGFDSCRPGQRVGPTGRASVAGQGAFPEERSQDQALILGRFGMVVEANKDSFQPYPALSAQRKHEGCRVVRRRRLPVGCFEDFHDPLPFIRSPHGRDPHKVVRMSTFISQHWAPAFRFLEAWQGMQRLQFHQLWTQN